MKIKIQPVRNNLSGETCGFVEIFDPRVVPARPAVPEQLPDKATGHPGNAAEPAFLGTISCIARYYDQNGNTVGLPIRNGLTELTPEQYAAWDSSVNDDNAYFARCVMANLGLVAA